MKRHRTVTAKRAGICPATGKPFPVGTPLIKDDSGLWIVAPSTLTDPTAGRPEKAAMRRAAVAEKGKPTE